MMTCDDAIVLIHLDRPGERSEREERALAAHLRTCSTCRDESILVARMASQMDEILHAAPPPTHVGEQARMIIEATRRLAEPHRDLVGLLLGIAARRAVRVGYLLTSAALVTVMLMQVFAQPSPGRLTRSDAGPYITYHVEVEELTTLPLPPALKDQVQNDGTIELRKRDIERSAGSIGQLMLASLTLSDRQRSYATRILTSLARTSKLSFRLGKIGG